MAPMRKRIEMHLSLDTKDKLRENQFFGKFHFGKPRLYLGGHMEGFGSGCGKALDKSARKMNGTATASLEKRFAVFLPQRDNPFGILNDKSQGYEMAFVDAFAIMKAEVFFAVGGFEKDTSWECGFAAGKRSFNVLYLPDDTTAAKHQGDWMLLLSFDCIIAPPGWPGAVAPDVKVVGIDREQGLGEQVAKLFRQWKKERFAWWLQGILSRDG